MTARASEPGYFDALYASDLDPWKFETSAYEAAKYNVTLAALERRWYRNAVEIGCSIGVLTQRLATRCERLLGTDVAQVALDQAAARCIDLPHVGFALSTFPEAAPVGLFDLIVVSEVLYYFDRARLLDAAERMREMASPAADILLVHWLGPTPDYPLTGDEAVGLFTAAIEPWAKLRLRSRSPQYRLDLFQASTTA